jgi:hypothetical protein
LLLLQSYQIIQAQNCISIVFLELDPKAHLIPSTQNSHTAKKKNSSPN